MDRKSFLLALGAGVVSLSGNRPAGAADGKPPVPRRAVIPAALTPIAPDGALDLEGFRRHIRDLSEVAGVSAIMVNGASGHDNTLTRDERRRLLGEALAGADSRVPILAALRENREESTLAPFAADAQAEGVQAMIVMPIGDKASHTFEGAMARFDSACSAAGLPVAIYQSDYSTETLTKLAALPPVFAIKEGSGSPVAFERNMRSVRALGREVAIWSTHSRWLLSDLALGADGILSGMGSVVADLHVALADAVERSDLAAARRVNDRIYPLASAFYAPGPDAHARMKYALKRLGRQSHDNVRPPVRALDDADRGRIDEALRKAGLL